jgi:hypothetical protein
MATTKRRWPLVLAGIAVFLVVAVIALAVVATMFFRESVQLARGTDRPAAQAAFDAAKQQFPDVRPLLELDGDRRPRYLPGLETRRNPGTVTSLHMLAWDAEDRALATVTLPMWLLRMKTGPIVFGDYVSGMEDHGVRIEPADLERYGPGVVMEFEGPDGDRVLLTAR